MRVAIVSIVAALLMAAPAWAQQSASYELTEQSLNAGGGVMASASFKVSYDAVGSPVVGWGMTGPSYRLDASFGAAYPPPGEVAGLHFTGRDTLAWHAERSAGAYGVYRDLVDQLPGLDYGHCLQGEVGDATVTDREIPPARKAFFYLVTASNRLGEEGTKGHASSGNERANDAPCP